MRSPMLPIAALLVGLSFPALAEPIPFYPLKVFDNSKIRTGEQHLLKTQAEYLSFWRRHAGPISEPPKVDFGQDWVIAVVLGEQPTLGYSACVSEVASQANTLAVLLRAQNPPADTFVSMAAASPGCLVRLSHQPLRQVDFRYQNNSSDELSSRIPLPMRTLSQVSNSRIMTSRYVVAQDLESFRQLWIEHAGSEESMPMVDFSKEMVVAAFMGEQPSGGFALNISEVAEASGRLQIRLNRSQPGPEQMVIQMLTAPAHLVAIPRRDLPIDFEGI